MLIDYSVTNFRSIKEKVTLSMIATSDKTLKDNVINTSPRLLKSAVIYGPNASGKTNLLFSLVLLRKLVQNSHNHQKDTKIEITPFKLDNEWKSKPTTFEICFIRNKIKYVYRVVANTDKIFEESLWYYPKNKKALIFERKNVKHYTFRLDIKKQKAISEHTPENVLYLSRATQFNYPKVLEAFNWFSENLRAIGPMDDSSLTNFTIQFINENKEQKELVIRALKNADLGIEDIHAEIENIESAAFFRDLPSDLQKLIKKGGGGIVKITTQRKTNKSKAEFYFDEESHGTRRMFALIGPWIYSLKNGCVLIVDEMDVRLHHLLIQYLISLFHDPNQNKKNAQLIFATHNTNLFSQDIFRRDQIWLIDKKQDASSDLYSLAEYSPRKDQNIEKRYLLGRYGAIPVIKESRVL